MFKNIIANLLWSLLTLLTILSFGCTNSGEVLDEQYKIHAEETSDINEHLPTLYELAKDCNSVAELGVRSMVATWAFLKGLKDSTVKGEKSYHGVDLDGPPADKLKTAESLAKGVGIKFSFTASNDLEVELGDKDLIFIDTLHTYCHLSKELKKFAPTAKKYIALHDTSDPWGSTDQPNTYNIVEQGCDPNKHGLWLAVEDFLKDNQNEWELLKRYENNHGLTVLKRKN
jgi:hypothetical protein